MKEIAEYQIPELPGNARPVISVCVAVYNSEDYLPRCIDSVLAQTYSHLEIILVDDGSTDSSGRICDAYAQRDDRIRVIHKPNGGLYTTRNEGIEAATGDYICFLDGDDYIDPEMYEYMLRSLISSGADICVDRYRCVYEDGSVSDRSTDSAFILEGREILDQFLIEDEAILIQNCAWNKLYPRDLIGSLRFPDRWYEDMLYTTRLLSMTGKLIYLDHAYHNYICERSTSIMNMGINPHIFTDLIPNLFDRSAFLTSIGAHDEALISDYMLCKKLLRLVDQVTMSSDPDKAEHLERLDGHLRGMKDRAEIIFGISVASENEYRKYRLYIKSPALYNLMIRLNEDVRLPVKARLKRLTGR